MHPTHLKKEDDVRAAWGWNDPTTYLWYFSPSGDDFRRFFGRMTILLLGVPALVLILWAVSLLSPAFFANAYLMAALTLVLAWATSLWVSSRRKSPARYGARRVQFWLLTGAIALLLCVLAEPGHLKDVLPEVRPTRIGPLVAYYYDNVLDVLLLSLPQQLGYRLSSLEAQGSATWLLQGVRALIGTFALLAVGSLLRSTAVGAEFFGTVKECFDRALGLTGSGNAEVRRVGIIRQESGADAPLRDVVKAYEHLPDGERATKKEPDPKSAYVRDAWDWEDPNVYQWELKLPPRSRVAVTLLLATYLILAPVILLPGVYLLYYFFQYVAGLLVLAVCKVVLFAMRVCGFDVTTLAEFWTLGTATELFIKLCMYLVVPLILLGLLLRRFRKAGEKPWLVGTLTFEAFAAITVLLLLVGLAVPGSTSAQGFTVPPGAGLWNWYLFAVENFVDALLFGIPTRIGFHPSGISPATHWGNLVTVFLRVLIGAGVVAVLRKWVGPGYSRQIFVHGTVSAAWAECSLYSGHPEALSVRVRRLGSL